MADNNGDGVRGDPGDGVDPNRNFPDATGAATTRAPRTIPSTRRTAAPARPPSRRRRRCCACANDVDFAFQKNDHTAAELLLYPLGYQQYTWTPGQRRSSRPWPATTSSRGSPTRCSRTASGTRSPTGSTRTSAPSSTSPTATRSRTPTTQGILGFTPEGSEPDPAKVPPEVVRLRVPGRRGRRSRPSSSATGCSRSTSRSRRRIRRIRCRTWATTTRNFYVDSFRGLLRRPAVGRGRREEVAGARSSIRWRINDGPVQTGDTRRFYQGERVRDGARHLLRPPARSRARRPGRVTRSRSGSRASRQNSSRFTYTVRRRSNADVLILSAENYTAGNPGAGPGRAALPDVLHGRARRQRRGLRDLRRRPARQPLAAPPRRAEPLRRGDLVHGRRLPHPAARAAAPERARPGWRSRR